MDSYKQGQGDVLVWTYEANVYTPSDVGKEFKINITKVNQTLKGGYLYDTLYATVDDAGWVTQNVLVGAYNNSKGVHDDVSYIRNFLMPRNGTAINDSLFSWYSMLGMTYHSWTPGPNGHDGKYEAWDSDAAGNPLPGKSKYEIEYNVDGIAKYYREYNGTGSKWDLIYGYIMGTTGGQITGGFNFPWAILIALLGTASVLTVEKYIREKKSANGGKDIKGTKKPEEPPKEQKEKSGIKESQPKSDPTQQTLEEYLNKIMESKGQISEDLLDNLKDIAENFWDIKDELQFASLIAYKRLARRLLLANQTCRAGELEIGLKELEEIIAELQKKKFQDLLQEAKNIQAIYQKAGKEVP